MELDPESNLYSNPNPYGRELALQWIAKIAAFIFLAPIRLVTILASQQSEETTPAQTHPQQQIEDYPNGYPRYSALVASHNTFQICRRFTKLRTRLLLVKQDGLSILEKQLDKLDRGEAIQLRLGSCREDDNPQRQAVLAKIDVALTDYGMPSPSLLAHNYH